ncbi:hypothetical protein [Brevibacterium jeotgali]|uniref:DUF4287 domain-containing protein n=1 Tax=Brevibacterium jeotgali TaxID=1262550 RepID=A0A2H1L1F7_9MICO|nr:hypothetical protein [Brevibacterium jeotgali]TWC02094.1 hypothetical protein FB108_0758 [Brevibacterium jeotgali]SMY10555.1 hypothetical protein BJEO58_00125 [Brevibacterium jeotgali]
MSDTDAPRTSAADAAPAARAADTDSPAGAAAIERATGLDWAAIAAAFDEAGGTSLSHAQLARAIEPLFTGRVENPGWWAQGATVAYEQAIGRRVSGQSSTGDFQVSASRTLPGAAEDLRTRSAAEVVAAGRIAGLAVEPGGRESDTPKRLYWRTGLEAGAKLEVSVEPKEGDRCLVTLTATKLSSQEQRDAARADLRTAAARL